MGKFKAFAAANNLFGVKAFSDWTGRKITLSTKEWCNGVTQIVDAAFRVYDSFNESIEDHSKLLGASRYKLVGECLEYRTACERILDCGYATDPDYAEKLICIIEENKLYEFDNIKGSDKANKILKFQRLCNILAIRDEEGNALEEDNILGYKTSSCICRMPLLIAGSRGAAVQFVQECLGIEPVDGEFGPITKRSVIEFQKDHNIAVDGIVGIQTWTTILTT